MAMAEKPRPRKNGRPRKTTSILPRQAFKTSELAAIVGVHPQTIRRAIESGQLKAAQTGTTGPLLISRTEATIWWKTRGGGELFAEPMGENGSPDTHPAPPQSGESGAQNTPESRAKAILNALKSGDTAKRNAAIIQLAKSDERTVEIVTSAAARAVEAWDGPDDDFADWRALDSEPVQFPEEPANYLEGLYRADNAQKGVKNS